MDAVTLERFVNEGLTQREIASRIGKSHTTVRHWLKKFNLSTKINPVDSDTRYCPRCDNRLPLTDFYSRRNGEGNSSYCKKCTTLQVTERQVRLKQQLVEYKGGKCERCGYCTCNAALEFHHNDPSEKDFSLSQVKLTTFNEKIKNELDKCTMLCANCHREVHQELGLSSNG